MKIIYLHQYFNTPAMSGGTRSYEMARRLVDAGHEVNMITSWREPIDKKDWFEDQLDGIRVHWLPVRYSNHMSYKQRIAAFFSFAFRASNRAIDLGGDVVFATSTPLTIAIPGVNASRKLGIPMVFEVRDLWPELPIAIGALNNPLLKYAARRLEKYAYAHSARIVALSPGMADGVSRAGYDKNCIDIIPNSADLALFKPNQDAVDRFLNARPELVGGPIVLYPGTLGKINGVGYLARLAALVRSTRPDIRFVVIGDGIERAEIVGLAQELGVLDVNFFMYPKASKREIPDAFAAAAMVISLFVDLPEMWANSANKFFDALASGTAVAINYGGWQATLLQESSAGVVLPPDASIAAKLFIDYFANDSTLIQAGYRARALAEEKFSRDLLAQQLETVLEKAVAAAH